MQTKQARLKLLVYLILALFIGDWLISGWPQSGKLVLSVTLQVLQVVVIIAMSILQFVAIFWFLSRGRVYWINPGETGYGWKDYRGNPEIVRLASEVVTLLKGAQTFKGMGGEAIRGLLLCGPPGTGKSYLAQVIANEAGIPFAYASVPGDTPILVRHNGETRLVDIGEFADQFHQNGESDVPVPVSGYETLGYTKGQRTKGNRKHFSGAKFVPFTHVFRHWESEIYEIRYVGGSVRATGNHSVFVRGNRGQLVAKEVRDLQPGEILIALPHRVGRFTNWLENRDMHESIQGTGPVLDLAKDDKPNGRPSGGPTELVVTPEFCRLLGYYAAEGVVNARCVRFTFHKEETAYHEDVTRLMTQYFNTATPVINQKDGNASITLVFGSARANRLMERLCGTLAEGKRVPDMLYGLPEDFFLEFVKGYSYGDGHISKHGFVEARTVSRNLAVGLTWLSRMHGYQVEMRPGKPLKPAVIDGRLCNRLPIYTLTWGKENNPFTGRLHNPRTLLPRIKSIEKLPFDGYVYDLCGCENEAFFGGERPVLLHNSAPGFQNMFFGVGNLRVMAIYKKARKMATKYGACIIFIDEIDAIGASRSGGAGGGMMGMMGGGSGLLNELLLQMDPPNIDTSLLTRLLRQIGIKRPKAERPVVLTIAATNLPTVLDSALLRPGRFDRQIWVDVPDFNGRKDVLQYYIDRVKSDNTLDVDRCSLDTIGYSPAQLKHVLNESVILAHQRGADSVAYTDFRRAMELYEWGVRQPITSMKTSERRRIAYHEAGHAVAQYLLQPQNQVWKVTIVRHGGALGLAATKPKEEQYHHSAADMEAMMQVCLASRAVEELFLGEKLGGVTSDLQQATKLAAFYLGAVGMGDELYSHLASGNPMEGIKALRPKINKLLNQQMELVKVLVQDNATFVHAIAEALLERSELTGDEVSEIYEKSAKQEEELS